jgi:predicted acylesterase/phospholipase RssA
MGAVVLDAAARRASPPRTGLVFGAGGVTGAAWMTGALPALQDRLPGAIGGVAVIAGTSAGSVLAAGLRCGCSIEELSGWPRCAADHPSCARSGPGPAKIGGCG